MPHFQKNLPAFLIAACFAAASILPVAAEPVPGEDFADAPIRSEEISDPGPAETGQPEVPAEAETPAEPVEPIEPADVAGPVEATGAGELPGSETAAASETMIASATGLILPMPGEWFMALQRTGRPQWRTLYRPPVPGMFSYRPRIAFNLGTVFADAFLASQATDAQQVKNLGRDLVELTRGLGVATAVTARLNSITETADREDWITLHTSLEAALNEVSVALVQQQDQDLVTLISLGLWLRTLMIVSAVVDGEYTPKGALLLRQNRVAELLQVRLEMFSPRQKKDPRHVSMVERVNTICTMVTIPLGELPTPQEAESIHRASALLIEDFSRREQP